jgi:hypothetical protein
MTADTLWCAQCGRAMSPAEALEVVAVRTGRIRHIHRPSVRGRCFGGIGTRDVETISIPQLETGDGSAPFRTTPATSVIR